MMIYLARLTHKLSQESCLKTGHTQGKFADRFSGSEYDDFEVERIDHIFLSANDWKVAKAVTEVLEEAIRVVIPAKDPSFMIEDFFGVEAGSLKIGGVTELTFPKDTEEENMMINLFKRFKKSEYKFKRIMEKY